MKNWPTEPDNSVNGYPVKFHTMAVQLPDIRCYPNPGQTRFAKIGNKDKIGWTGTGRQVS